MRPPSALALAAGLALAPAGARAAPADDAGWSLRWQAPPTCPAEAAVQERVAALLAGSPPPASPTRFTGVVRRDGDGFALDLRARSANGKQQRRVVHRDCAVLGEAGALSVAMAIDPAVAGAADSRMLALLRGEPAPVVPADRAITRRIAASAGASAPAAVDAAPEPPTSGPTAPADRAITRRIAASAGAPEPPVAATSGPNAPADRAAKPAGAIAQEPADVRPAASVGSAETSPPGLTGRWLGVRLLAGVGAGPLPGVHGVFAGALTLALTRRARLEANAGVWTRTQHRLAADREVGADLTLVTGGLRGCGVPGGPKVELPLCGGVELGSMRGTGVGLAEVASERALWAALTAGAAVVVSPVPRFALWFGIDAHVALTRPRFLIGGVGEIWRAGAVGARAQLGVEIRLQLGSPRPSR